MRVETESNPPHTHRTREPHLAATGGELGLSHRVDQMQGASQIGSRISAPDLRAGERWSLPGGDRCAPEAALMHLEIDGSAVDTKRVVCHYQSQPWPGGHAFRLVINQDEAPPDLRPPNSPLPDTGTGASQLMVVIQGVLDRSKPSMSDPLEWILNRVDLIESVGGKIVVTGTASRKVDGEFDPVDARSGVRS